MAWLLRDAGVVGGHVFRNGVPEMGRWSKSFHPEAAHQDGEGQHFNLWHLETDSSVGVGLRMPLGAGGGKLGSSDDVVSRPVFQSPVGSEDTHAGACAADGLLCFPLHLGAWLV